MNTQRIVIAIDNIEFLDSQLLTLVQQKKLSRKEYEILRQNVDYTLGHLREFIKESEAKL